MVLLTKTKLVVGRGKVYFGRFSAGTYQSEGERYIGNTPGFTIGRSVEEVTRFTSYNGQQVQLQSEIIRETMGANLVLDSIDVENLSMWFSGTIDSSGQEPIGLITENFTVKRDRFYQLGATVEPFGVKYVEPDIVFKKNGSDFELLNNIEVNRPEGRFFVLADADDIVDGDVITVTFQWRGSKSEAVSSRPISVMGCLRLIADNPVGPQNDYFIPYVAMKPQGSFDLKGDQWQQMQFSADILKLNPVTEFIYVLKRAIAEFTEDELAIIELGPMSLDDFPFWEDQLNTIININMPAADYAQAITYP